MKYTFQDKTGKERTINIDEKEIKSLIKIYDLSVNDAIELYLFDNDYIENDYVNELTAKAKVNGNMRIQGGQPRKPRERKPDEIKRALIAALGDCVENLTDLNVKDVQIENIERIISFKIKDDTYTVTLSKKRRPKD